jgi:hypothetical protein
MKLRSSNKPRPSEGPSACESLRTASGKVSRKRKALNDISNKNISDDAIEKASRDLCGMEVVLNYLMKTTLSNIEYILNFFPCRTNRLDHARGVVSIEVLKMKVHLYLVPRPLFTSQRHTPIVHVQIQAKTSSWTVAKLWAVKTFM